MQAYGECRDNEGCEAFRVCRHGGCFWGFSFIYNCIKWRNTTKVKESDRQIHDYLEYVSESKKNDVATEVILQVGDKEFWADKTREQWDAMK